MSTAASLLLAFGVFAMKPLYYVHLFIIAIVMGKSPIPPGLWRYTETERWSLAALFVGFFLLFRFQGIFLGLAVGFIGIVHLTIIHLRYFDAIKKT